MRLKAKYLILLTQLLLPLSLLLKTKCLKLIIQSRKTDYNTKISEIEKKNTTDHDHDKYITTEVFKKLTAKNFTARLAHANLVSINNIANFLKKTDFDNEPKNINKRINKRFDT